MAAWPAYVEYAFSAIQIIATDEEYIKDFAAHWGGLELATFARALREGQYRDQEVAAFAVGYTDSTWARDLLLPFLHHEYPEVRWAAALTLGEMREEAAFPMLINMLQEFLPPHPAVEFDWYDVQHMHVASILGSWGKHAAIPALCDTLARMWQVEQQRSPDEDAQMWWHYQDALTYALGQLGAFNALADLELPQSLVRLWTVNIVMGYLNAEKIYKKNVLGIILDAPLHEELAAFLALVSALLQEKMGLSPQEATSSIENYGHDYFDRWGPTVMSWSKCKN